MVYRQPLPVYRIIVALLCAALILPLVALASSDWQIVKRVVDGDTLILASGERAVSAEFYRQRGLTPIPHQHPFRHRTRRGCEAKKIAFTDRDPYLAAPLQQTAMKAHIPFSLAVRELL